jgi:hypothetical protein
LFLHHDIALGDRAMQPFHFSRGYLLLGLAAVTWRAVMVLAGNRRMVPRWAILAVALTLPDQALFFAREALAGVRIGFVTPELDRITAKMRDLPPGQVFLTDWPYAYTYIAAASHQVPYVMPDSMVVPWDGERLSILRETANDRAGKLTSLGISLAVAHEDGQLHQMLLAGKWQPLAREGKLVLLSPDPPGPRPVPVFPPPPAAK